MNRKKAIILIAMVALLLTFTVSGTIAWLADSTEEVENVFTPAKVDTEIVEEFSSTHKTSIKVRNANDKGSNIPVFVRVSVSGYYVNDEGNIVDTWSGDIGINSSDWFKGSDGYYYYKESIKPGESTNNLLNSGIELEKRADGSYLQVNVVHQSIQFEPETTVESIWPVDATNANGSGTISQKSAGN